MRKSEAEAVVNMKGELEHVTPKNIKVSLHYLLLLLHFSRFSVLTKIVMIHNETKVKT